MKKRARGIRADCPDRRRGSIRRSGEEALSGQGGGSAQSVLERGSKHGAEQHLSGPGVGVASDRRADEIRAQVDFGRAEVGALAGAAVPTLIVGGLMSCAGNATRRAG
jgi:hypothetical protein